MRQQPDTVGFGAYLRDAILEVSGSLNPRQFGPAVKAPIAAEAIVARNLKDGYPSDVKDTEATRRRSEISIPIASTSI